jgi:16S rRNA (uracil1498-N3)-methyltransferase
LFKVIPRIYQSQALKIQREISLDAWGIQHVKALRLQAANKLIIFNGDGVEYLGQINTINKKSIEVALLSEQACAREPSLNLHLIQAISRGERMDYTVQKATELGVASIIPVISERCEVKLTPERLEKRQSHWQQIAISACEQTGRNQIPTVHSPKPFSQALRHSGGLALALDPDAAQTLSALVIDFPQLPSSVFILIGPEGGLTPTEIQLAKQHGFYGLRLGKRVLRTETAGPVVLAVLHAYWGDFL